LPVRAVSLSFASSLWPVEGDIGDAVSFFVQNIFVSHLYFTYLFVTFTLNLASVGAQPAAAGCASFAAR
jgi:hypothetical protein